MRCVFLVLVFSSLGFAQLNKECSYFLIEEAEWQQLTKGQKQKLQLVLNQFHNEDDDELKLQILSNYMSSLVDTENVKAGFLYAQWMVNYIDKNRKLLKERRANELKMLAYKRKALRVLVTYYFKNIENEGVYDFLLEQLHNSERFNDRLSLILINEALGAYFSANSEFRKAEKFYKECLRISDFIEDKLIWDEVIEEVLGGYFGITEIYLMEYRLNSAKKYIEKALRLAEESGNFPSKTICLELLGECFIRKREFSSAMRCFYQVIDMNANSDMLFLSYIRLSAIFIEFKDLESASKYMELSKRMKVLFPKFREAQLLFLKGKILLMQGKRREAILLFEKLFKEVSVLKASGLIIDVARYLGIVYEDIGRRDLALSYYKKSLGVSKREHDVFRVIKSSCVLGRFLRKTGNILEARHTLENALHLAESIEEPSLLMELTEQLYEIYKEENNVKKAFMFLELYKHYSDSVSGFEEIRIALKEKNNYEEKLLALKNQSKIEEKEKKTYIWIIVATCVFVLFIISHYISFRRKQKNRLLENKIQIVELTLSDFVFRKKIEFIESKKEAENKIKNRVSQDLHDSVCTSLTVLNLELQNKFNDDMKMITPFIEKLNFINREIRDIAHDLDSDYQEAYLIPVIEELVAVIRNSGANIHVNFFPKVGYESLDNTIKDSLIKITKESLINAVKHGEANTIELDFVLSHDELCYIIEDNGIGFDLDRISLGLGILNMKDRVKKLGGELNIDSTIGKGTTICVVIPV